MNADGSRQTNLTNNQSPNPLGDVFPAWSPDGRRIAFQSDRDGEFEIYVINADGSNLTRLTGNPAKDVFPAWSPDGSHIAFVSDRDGNAEIYVMNADSPEPTPIPPPPTPTAKPATAIAISAGDGYTCALTTAGGVKCWGENYEGQLGDGTATGRLAPVDASGLTSGVTAISAGSNHTCALTAAGGVKCWGARGTASSESWTPVDVSGLTSGVTAISAGVLHTCALTTAGGVKCWGSNVAADGTARTYGQLGDGTQSDRSTPVDVTGLTSGVTAISAGRQHTCALTAAGGVKCWGGNIYGQVGDGTDAGRLTPVDVTGLTSGVTAISAGLLHTCALTTAGGVKCWGYNGDGHLGDGTRDSRLTPVDVTGLTSGVTAISAGSVHTCALTVAGAVKCWGFNVNGRLGDGTETGRLTPVDVSGLTTGVTAISAGREHTCALTAGGGVKCWGNNENGALGDGTTRRRLTPVSVVGFPN